MGPGIRPDNPYQSTAKEGLRAALTPRRLQRGLDEIGAHVVTGNRPARELVCSSLIEQDVRKELSHYSGST